MPQQITDQDQFPDVVTAPAPNDLASATALLAALQAFANRTFWLKNRIGLSTRKIDTPSGSGLQGGGDLTQDRSLSLRLADASLIIDGANGVKVGTITDVQHGNRAGGALHALVDIANNLPGFMSVVQAQQLSAINAGFANKADISYVDQIAAGLDVKGSVDAVATTNITLSGLAQTVDGKAINTAGMRVAAFGQTDATTRGIYIAAAGAWTRAPDASTSAQVTTGMYTWTNNGANKGGWILVTPDPITLGTTALTFERYTFGLTNAAPPAIGAASDAGLSDTTGARGQHTHAHGSHTDPTAHAAATTSANGFMTAAHAMRLADVYKRPLNTQTASYSFLTADSETLVAMNSATPLNLAILSDGNGAYPAGVTFLATQIGSAPFNLLAQQGTTVNGVSYSAAGGTILVSSPNTIYVCTKIAASTWTVTKMGTGAYLRPSNAQAASYTLQPSDAERLLAYTGTAGIVLVTEALQPYADGTTFYISQNSATCFIYGWPGVTINGELHTYQKPICQTVQNVIYKFTKIGTNNWTFNASITPAQLAATPTNAGLQSATDKARADLIYSLLTGTKNQRRQCRLDGWPGDPRPDGYGGTYASWQMRGAFPVSIAMPSGGNADQLKWMIDLQPEFPANATAITSFDVRIIGPSAQTNSPPFPTVTPPTFTLVSYDASGTRTVEIAAQSDTTATLAAYKLPHSITWFGSVGFSPAKRYVLEVVAESGGQAQNGTQLIGVTMGVDYYSDLDAIVQTLSPFDWYRADSVTLTSGNVTALKNRAQGATNTVDITGTIANPANDATFNGQLALTLPGTAHGISSRPAADYAFMSNGAGSDVFEVFSQSVSGYAVLHTTLSGSNPGARTIINPDGSIAHEVYNTTTNFPSGTLEAYSINTPRAVESTYMVGVSVSQNGASDNNGKGIGQFAAFAGSAANPAVPLNLFRDASNVYKLNGKWCETIVFNRVLSSLERQFVREYVQARYGIAATATSGSEKKVLAAAPISWGRADLVTLASGKVQDIHDRAKHGHRLLQATAANQGTPNLIGNGRAVVEQRGSHRYTSTFPNGSAYWASLSNGLGSTVFHVSVKRSGSPGGVEVHFGTQNTVVGGGQNGVTCYYHSSPGDFFYHNSGSAVVVNLACAAAANDTLYIREVSSATAQSPNTVYRRNGANIGTAPYSPGTPVAGGPAGNFCVGGQSGLTSSGAYEDFAEVIVFDRILTAQESSDVRAYLAERYGQAA